jgi:hypothetical protein
MQKKSLRYLKQIKSSTATGTNRNRNLGENVNVVSRSIGVLSYNSVVVKRWALVKKEDKWWAVRQQEKVFSHLLPVLVLKYNISELHTSSHQLKLLG